MELVQPPFLELKGVRHVSATQEEQTAHEDGGEAVDSQGACHNQGPAKRDTKYFFWAFLHLEADWNQVNVFWFLYFSLFWNLRAQLSTPVGHAAILPKHRDGHYAPGTQNWDPKKHN